MVNLHYTSVFHLRRTLYSGVTRDLPDLSVLQVAEVLKKHTITLPQLLVFYITIDLSVLQVAEVKKKKQKKKHYTTTVISILHNYYTVSKFLKLMCLYLRLDYTIEQETVLKLYIFAFTLYLIYILYSSLYK